jgi:hypothetical protein
MKKLIELIKAETPKLWRDLQKLSLSLSAIAGVLLQYNESNHILSSSDILVLKWVIGIGVALSAYGQTKTVKK